MVHRIGNSKAKIVRIKLHAVFKLNVIKSKMTKPGHLERAVHHYPANIVFHKNSAQLIRELVIWW